MDPKNDPKSRAATLIIAAVLEGIEAAGPAGIPSGHLYMHLQSILGQEWTLEVHETVIQALVETRKITDTNHLLVVVNS